MDNGQEYYVKLAEEQQQMEEETAAGSEQRNDSQHVLELAFDMGLNLNSKRSRDTSSLAVYVDKFENYEQLRMEKSAQISTVNNNVWEGIFVYGHPDFKRRNELWNELTCVDNNLHVPRAFIGEFNDVIAQHEKVGLHPKPTSQIDIFRRFVDKNALMDFELQGTKFTWFSNPRNGFVTKERIDRVLANWEWRRAFQHATISALPAMSSDYTPLVLNNLFKAFDNLVMSECISKIPIRVTEVMNRELMKEVSDQEIKEATFSLRSLKTSGPDGLNGIFFQKHWAIIEKEVSYKIKINGVLSRSFVPQRGLRQGDPLSPYLFIIAAEVFTILMDKAKDEGRISGVRIAPTALAISHLLFADDCIIFSNDSEEEVYQLITVLNMYTEALVPIRNRVEIEEILGLPVWDQPGKYLGLPAQWGRSKNKALRWIEERVSDKLCGWKEKLLSQSGREVLKAVYFSNEDFKVTKARKGASWIWKSIVHGKDFLLRNGRWLIGNGKKVRILDDNWILNMKKSPVVINDDVTFVKELISEGQGWNISELRKYFDGDAVGKIIRTPVSVIGIEDKLSWPLKPDGKYTIKTGYHATRKEQHLDNNNSPSTSDDFKDLWRDIWKLREPESTEHALLLCPWTRAAWFGA
ncbi:uncharacterized protein [Arachis hypogaea]|uniref:uncharacterized protein n=1 Tax=Arachis hypogaea TaxID=3818 RepID=UPI003B211F87